MTDKEIKERLRTDLIEKDKPNRANMAILRFARTVYSKASVKGHDYEQQNISKLTKLAAKCAARFSLTFEGMVTGGNKLPAVKARRVYSFITSMYPFEMGVNDETIANVVGIDRTSVLYNRKKAIQLLNEEIRSPEEKAITHVLQSYRYVLRHNSNGYYLKKYN